MTLLSTHTTREIQHMPLELCDEDSQTGQKMNIVNTMVMFSYDTTVHVNNSQMEHVEGYVCLGQHSNLKKQDNVIQVKVVLANHRDIFIRYIIVICMTIQYLNNL